MLDAVLERSTSLKPCAFGEKELPATSEPHDAAEGEIVDAGSLARSGLLEDASDFLGTLGPRLPEGTE